MKSTRMLVLLIILLIPDDHGIAAANYLDGNIKYGLQLRSMRTNTKTEAQVYHLEEDLFITGNILFSELNNLMTTGCNTTSLIVGSGPGYSEGTSAQAQFRLITGFLQINSSLVLVVDSQNNCLRFVSRIRNLTSPFAGSCRKPGFRDGQQSLFYWPISVIKNIADPLGAIVTDSANRALRLLNLATGDVKTIVNFTAEPWGAAFASDKETVYITFNNFLGRFSIKTSTFAKVEWTDQQRQYGGIHLSTFQLAKGIVCMTKYCIVADARKNQIIFIDFKNRATIALCSDITVNATDCLLEGPYGLLLRSDNLLIGGNLAITSLTVREYSLCEDISVRLSSGEQEKCVEVTLGHTICLPNGIYRYRILDRNCTIQIKITKVMDVCSDFPCSNSGTCTAGENDTYTCSCGDGWTGRNCEIEMNSCLLDPCRNNGRCSMINNTFTCSCLDGWSGVTCERVLRERVDDSQRDITVFYVLGIVISLLLLVIVSLIAVNVYLRRSEKGRPESDVMREVGVVEMNIDSLQSQPMPDFSSGIPMYMETLSEIRSADHMYDDIIPEITDVEYQGPSP